jgi:hypothetical protein
VKVPEELCQQAENWLKGRFDNIETLIAFVLQELMRADTGKLDQQEEEMIQQRLRDLGYI